MQPLLERHAICIQRVVVTGSQNCHCRPDEIFNARFRTYTRWFVWCGRSDQRASQRYPEAEQSFPGWPLHRRGLHAFCGRRPYARPQLQWDHFWERLRSTSLHRERPGRRRDGYRRDGIE